MKLDKFIQELLVEKEMAIVPGLGAFIAEYKPAEVVEDSDEIKPPSTKISFNPQIRNNDGALVGLVADVKHISHFEALMTIERERDNIIYCLDKGEEVTLEEIGILSYNTQQEIYFTSLKEENLLLDSFGLEATTILETDTEEPEPVVPPTAPKEELLQAEKNEEPELKTDENEKKKRKGWLWLLIFIPILAVLGYFLWQQQNAVNPENKSVTETTAKEEEEEKKIVATLDTITQEETIVQTTDSITTQENVSVQQQDSISEGPKYYLVTGSFSVEENADTYIKELKAKGIDAFPAGKKGRFFIVAVGSYNSFEEADKVKIKLMEDIPGIEGWIWKQ